MPRYRRRYNSHYSGKKLNHREWYTQVHSAKWDVPQDTNTHLQKVYFDQLKGDDCTILRTRGVINVDFVSPTKGFSAAFGALTLPNRYAAEASNLPNPFTATDTDDWFVWSPIIFTEVGAAQAGSSAYRGIIPVDSKAKRKLAADEGVLGVIGFHFNVAPGASAECNANALLRTLVGY